MSTAPVVKIAGTGAAAATWTTASYTPAANSREVAYVSAFKSTAGVALPTISDSAGNNWTQLASFETTTAANPNIRGVWFISDDVGGSPAARTVTVASTGAASMAVMVADVLSADTDGTLAQAAVGGEDLANGDPSCTFGSTPGASNICLAGASFGGGNTATARPTGFSNLANFNHSTARANSASYDVASASQGPLQYTSLNVRSIILAIELAPAGSSNKTLAAGAGSYALAGTDAALKLGRVVAADAGSYAMTGSAATLRRALPLVAGAGSYSLTGATASLLHSWKVAAGAGSYSLSGVAANLKVGKAVAAAAGAYSLAGSVASLLVSRKLAASAGSYALTGSDATLTKSSALTLAAGSGSYSLAGSAASLLLKRLVAASSGAYALTGANANLTYSGGTPPPASEYRHSGQMAAMGRMMNR